MKNKIKSFRDIVSNICSSNKAFFNNIKKSRGINLHFRALAAQILLLTLIYNIGILLIPVKQFILSNAILILILAFWNALKNILKEKVPDWINYYVSGNFFYDCELPFLNKCIVVLILSITGLIFLNNHLNNYKSYEVANKQ